VGHPNSRVLADLFHMAVMGNTHTELERAMPLAGDDFRPFFSVLARGGYSGPITMEGNGTPEQFKEGFATILRQAAESLE
jgi:sugar phosphate isomerase/epimerase